jgi:uncharacterized protein with FMN-binding domain
MPKKMPRRLVALSSSAIAAIYFAGFIATRAADAGIAADGSAASGMPTATVTYATTASTAASSSAPSVTAYRDGTYTGSGTSRRGNVTVSLTVASGRISNVSITRVTTEYPGSRISALAAQVVASQSSQVNNVTGATYSAQAFRLAVQAALQQASAA